MRGWDRYQRARGTLSHLFNNMSLSICTGAHILFDERYSTGVWCVVTLCSPSARTAHSAARCTWSAHWYKVANVRRHFRTFDNHHRDATWECSASHSDSHTSCSYDNSRDYIVTRNERARALDTAPIGTAIIVLFYERMVSSACQLSPVAT